MKSLKVSYRLVPLKAFKKFIKNRDTKERVIIDNKLMILSEQPNSVKLDTKSLKGYKNRYRLRVGKYRIIYEIYKYELIIILADGGSRGEIYK